MIGRRTHTSLSVMVPSASRMSTRPATLKSRSNQVYQSPPPYVCTPTLRKPLFFDAVTGLSLRHGLSVCAATTLKPFPAWNLPPRANAMMVVALRMKKYLPPGLLAHSCSARGPIMNTSAQCDGVQRLA